MTQQEVNTAEPMAVHDPMKGDWHLQRLVDMVNGTDIELGITLQVSGFAVSGTLFSGHKYFEEFAEAFVAGWEDRNVAEPIRKNFAQGADLYTATGDDAVSRPAPAYVHLKDARLFHAGAKPFPANQGILWRGRLSEVSGFFMGRLTAD